MGSYVPATPEQRQEMLSFLGLSDFDELYSDIPAKVRIGGLNLPEGTGELGVRRKVEAMAAKNHVFTSIFRGAGAYNHYIPSIVKTVAAKEAFLTTYTPYQPELSQGVLQSIFEYQTQICELTGMDASNASVYDGATAAAEAVAMCRERRRNTAYVSAAANPDVIGTLRTYCWANGTELVMIPQRDGLTDLESLKEMLSSNAACVYIEQPNYFGLIEDCSAAADIAHGVGAKLVMGVNPIAMALYKSPGECGADIAVGDGQPLGLGLNFGGPYLGFMTTTVAMTRKLPGRIVGESTDDKGRRAFVLTLQAREQHIRREKASSNICSNQALCALTAGAYLAAVGPYGLAEVANQSMAKAHYLCEKLTEAGFERMHDGEFFNEFVIKCLKPNELLAALETEGILGGMPVEGGILWCATELNTREEIDRLVVKCKEVCGK